MILRKIFWISLIFTGALVLAIVFFLLYPKFFIEREVIFYSGVKPARTTGDDVQSGGDEPKRVSKGSEPVLYFEDKDVSVKAELATNSYEWSRGLMFREKLEENSGMLFVFPNELPRSFWMKNVSFPLDIIFISKDMAVVDIKENFAPCKSFIFCPNYESKPAMYVLEVSAGFVAKNGIKIGDRITL